MTHKNEWGDPCSCGWFRPAHKEHVGFVHEAAKIDWLRERPDVQKDLRKRLIVNHDFPSYHPDADALLPWFLREHKNGWLKIHDNTDAWIDDAEKAEREYQQFIQAGFDPESDAGQKLRTLANETMAGAKNNMETRGLYDAHSNAVRSWAPKFAEMVKDQAKRGKGIDLMQHQFPDITDKYYEWEQEKEEREEEERRRNNGQVVHKYDDGWTLRRLRDKEEAHLEGELMGHCVGSYGGDIEHGNTNIYSLRDHKNQPHATMEIQPSGGNPEDPEQWVMPEHAWDELPMKDFRGVPIEDIRDYHDLKSEYGPNYIHRLDEHPAHGAYREFMKKAVEGGTAMPPVEGEVKQTQGLSNQPPLDEYTQKLDEFLQPHDLQSYKPWWDDHYVREGPENFRELLGHNGDEGEEFGQLGYPRDEWYEGEPEEYRWGENDAQEHGLAGPELLTEGPNYEKILDDLIDPEVQRGSHQTPEGRQPVTRPPWTGYSPEAGQYVLNHAKENDEREQQHPDWAPHRQAPATHMDELRSALESHMEDLPRPKFEPGRDYDHIEDPFQRGVAIDQAAQEFHHNLPAEDQPWYEMFDHLGPQLYPGWDPYSGAAPPRPIHPDQQPLWSPEGVPYNINRGIAQTGDPPFVEEGPLPNVFSKLAHPLYHRWVYSPASGNVELSDNGEGHPLDVRYHGDMAKQINEPGLVHGYAYRIGNAWRLLDYEHRPLEDPFVIAQVMQKLRGTDTSKPPEDLWEPADHAEAWDRLHYGIAS